MASGSDDPHRRAGDHLERLRVPGREHLARRACRDAGRRAPDHVRGANRRPLEDDCGGGSRSGDRCAALAGRGAARPPQCLDGALRRLAAPHAGGRWAMTLPATGPVALGAGARIWPRLRFLLSWAAALALLGVGLPKVIKVSWHGILPVLAGLHWPVFLGLVGLWVLGLYVHSFLLTAAAPSLTHRRALALNVPGSAVANVIPLGGAAGVELNRRMMRSWGIGSRGFTGYTVLTNLWDV